MNFLEPWLIESLLFSVYLRILDIDDNQPIFPVHSVKKTISEGVDVGEEIQIPSAWDPDSPAYGIKA